MSNVVSLPRSFAEKLRPLFDLVSSNLLSHAIDYTSSTERQVWRVLASDSNNYDRKSYELALMMAISNLEDGMRLLDAVKTRINHVMLDIQSDIYPDTGKHLP